MAEVKVRASLLRDGQKIIRPVFDDNMLLLVGEGSEVDERIRSLLRVAEIRWVSVEDNGKLFPWQIFKDREKQTIEVKTRFKTVKDRYTKTIERALLNHIEKGGK